MTYDILTMCLTFSFVFFGVGWASCAAAFCLVSAIRMVVKK